MAKKTDSFFDDEDLDEDLDEEEGKKAPEKKKPENEDPKPKDDDKDKIDWKAKYEAAEAEKLDRSYYDELVGLDDSLSGDTLDDLEGGKRYRELRGKGLSARAAYAALREEIAEASPDEGGGKSGKNHMSATNFRGRTPTTKMSREEREQMGELLPDLTDEELEALNRRVSGN